MSSRIVSEEEGQEVLLHKMGSLQGGKYTMGKTPGRWVEGFSAAVYLRCVNINCTTPV